MSECGVLSEHSTISSHGFVPTAVEVPSRGHLGREVENTRTGAQPVQTSPRGNGAVVCTVTVAATPRGPLCSAGALTPASTPKDARNHCRHPPGAGALVKRGHLM